MFAGCGSGESTTTPQQTTATATSSPETPATAGSFVLLTPGGELFSLDDLRGTLAFGIFFYDGNCTGCEELLSEMQANYGRFKQAGAELVAITTDLQPETRATVDRLGIEFPVLTDITGAASRSRGVIDPLNSGRVLPSLFIYNAAGDQLTGKVGATVDELPSIAEVLQTIQLAAASGTA
jgi:peroxiredoxin